jgi:uncharacterized protein YqgQ
MSAAVDQSNWQCHQNHRKRDVVQERGVMIANLAKKIRDFAKPEAGQPEERKLDTTATDIALVKQAIARLYRVTLLNEPKYTTYQQIIDDRELLKNLEGRTT